MSENETVIADSELLLIMLITTCMSVVKLNITYIKIIDSSLQHAQSWVRSTILIVLLAMGLVIILILCVQKYANLVVPVQKDK